MKIAAACENGMIFQHFGHTPEFAVFEIEDNRIASEKILACGESGHGALAGLLAENNIDIIICGGIGGGAVKALGDAGILTVGGAEGDVREVVKSFLAGTLQVRKDFHCRHHRENGEHSCGSHSCGSGSCH